MRPPVSKTAAQWEKIFEREFMALGPDTSLQQRRHLLISLLKRAIAGEQERCAIVADNYARNGRFDRQYACETADEIASRIRAPIPGEEDNL